MHPVLDKLRGTEKQWLVDLLYAFNAGNISKFDDLKKHWVNQPDLASHEVQMRQKISLLCLMEMTFRRPATDRQLMFEEISQEARLPVDEVGFCSRLTRVQFLDKISPVPRVRVNVNPI